MKSETESVTRTFSLIVNLETNHRGQTQLRVCNSGISTTVLIELVTVFRRHVGIYTNFNVGTI